MMKLSTAAKPQNPRKLRLTLPPKPENGLDASPLSEAEDLLLQEALFNEAHHDFIPPPDPSTMALTKLFHDLASAVIMRDALPPSSLPLLQTHLPTVQSCTLFLMAGHQGSHLIAISVIDRGEVISCELQQKAGAEVNRGSAAWRAASSGATLTWKRPSISIKGSPSRLGVEYSDWRMMLMEQGKVLGLLTAPCRLPGCISFGALTFALSEEVHEGVVTKLEHFACMLCRSLSHESKHVCELSLGYLSNLFPAATLQRMLAASHEAAAARGATTKLSARFGAPQLSMGGPSAAAMLRQTSSSAAGGAGGSSVPGSPVAGGSGSRMSLGGGPRPGVSLLTTLERSISEPLGTSRPTRNSTSFDISLKAAAAEQTKQEGKGKRDPTSAANEDVDQLKNDFLWLDDILADPFTYNLPTQLGSAWRNSTALLSPNLNSGAPTPAAPQYITQLPSYSTSPDSPQSSYSSTPGRKNIGTSNISSRIRGGDRFKQMSTLEFESPNQERLFQRQQKVSQMALDLKVFRLQASFVAIMFVVLLMRGNLGTAALVLGFQSMTGLLLPAFSRGNPSFYLSHRTALVMLCRIIGSLTLLTHWCFNPQFYAGSVLSGITGRAAPRLLAAPLHSRLPFIAHVVGTMVELWLCALATAWVFSDPVEAQQTALDLVSTVLVQAAAGAASIALAYQMEAKTRRAYVQRIQEAALHGIPLS